MLDRGAVIRRATSADAHAIAACLGAAFEPYRAEYTPGAFTDTVLSVTLDTTLPLAHAIAFYQHRGYAPTGRVADFYGMSLYECEKRLEARP
jgi:hypothetical protein